MVLDVFKLIITGLRDSLTRTFCFWFRSVPIVNGVSQTFNHAHVDTHRVEVEGCGAALEGIDGRLTAVERSLQGVVGRIDCRFAFWVLEREACIRKSICLRRQVKLG